MHSLQQHTTNQLKKPKNVNTGTLCTDKATGIQSTVNSTVINQFHGNAIVTLTPLIQSVYHGCCSQVAHGSKQCPTVPNSYYHLRRQPRRLLAFV